MDAKLRRRFPTIDACRKGARKRLPRFLFDYLEGGCDGETALARNRKAFERILISTRVGRTEYWPDKSTELFGRTWSLPFGISPCGYVDIVDPGTDLAAAAAAERVGAPFIASLVTIATLEEIAEIAPTSTWLQISRVSYGDIDQDLIKRAEAAGISTIVVTMDLPGSSKRVRDVKNGFDLPLRISPGFVLDVMTSPRWALSMLRRPDPQPGNFVKYMPKGTTSTSALMEVERLAHLETVWDDVKRFRDIWSGNMVLKGIVDPADAVLAMDYGADGIIVSGHGGRQFDAVLPTIDCLPGVLDAVGAQVPVMLDSGVRSGLDILRALISGARMVFSGRSFYFAAGAIGRSGPSHAFDILSEELDIVMRQAGLNSTQEVLDCDPEERLVRSSI